MWDRCVINAGGTTNPGIFNHKLEISDAHLKTKLDQKMHHPLA